MGSRSAEAAIGLASLPTFHHDPGRLSAAFVQERFRRVTLRATAVRYVCGGWGKLVDRLSKRAEGLGVVIQSGSRLERLPESPVIVAMSLEAASMLLGSELSWTGSRTAILDLGWIREAAGPHRFWTSTHMSTRCVSPLWTRVSLRRATG